jgi:hypothetical protein
MVVSASTLPVRGKGRGTPATVLPPESAPVISIFTAANRPHMLEPQQLAVPGKPEGEGFRRE